MAIQFLRGTKSTLSSSNQIFLAGQPVFESDSGQLKIGTGSSRYSALEYVGSIFENTSSGGGEVTFGGSGTNTYIDFPGGLRLSYGSYEWDEGVSDGNSLGSGLYYLYRSWKGLGVELTSVKSRYLCGSYTISLDDNTAKDRVCWIGDAGNDYSGGSTNDNGPMFRLVWSGARTNPHMWLNFMIFSR